MMNTFSKGFFLALLVTTTVVDATWQFTSSIEGKRDILQNLAAHRFSWYKRGWLLSLLY